MGIKVCNEVIIKTRDFNERASRAGLHAFRSLQLGPVFVLGQSISLREACPLAGRMLRLALGLLIANPWVNVGIQDIDADADGGDDNAKKYH
jgi:hypothetical protein